MKKAFKLMLATIAFLAITTVSADAAGTSYCQPIYGGGEVCPPSITFSLDKKVQNPTSGTMVDNLGTNDAKYAPGQTITFELVVTNTGKETLKDVVVTDTLPQNVTFVSGPGTFVKDQNRVEVKISSLEAGKSQKFTIVTKANAEISQSTVCVVNASEATESRGAKATDNAAFCIAKSTTPGKGGPVVQPPVKVTTTPQTGPEMFALAALIPTGAVGFFLRRKSKVS